MIKYFFRDKDAKGSIKGKVINFYGHIVAGAEVVAEASGEMLGKTISDDDGNFLLDNIPVGTRGILVKAKKGMRDADHTDLTHRGSYGNGKDEDNLIRITRKVADVEGVQVPLIDVPGPKVPEFELKVEPIGKFQKDVLGRPYAEIEGDEELSLDYNFSMEPKPAIPFGKFSLFAKVSRHEDDNEKALTANEMDRIRLRIKVKRKEYHWNKVPTFSINRNLDMVTVLVDNAKCLERPFNVSLEANVFLQEDKRKYVKFAKGYYKVR